MSLSSPPRPTSDEPAVEPASNGHRAERTGKVRRLMVRVAPYGFVALLIAAAAAGYFLVLDRDGASEPTVTAEVDTGSAIIARRDLQVRESLDGTLTYASASTVKATGAGTLTSLPAEGEIAAPGDVLYTVEGQPVLMLEGELSMWRPLGIGLDTTPVVNQLSGTVTAMVPDGARARQGDVLYRVDTEPVVALSGSFPAYRAMGEGVEDGRDVRQLEQSLVALGYDPDGTITVDRTFTAETEAAVVRMQEALGATADGIVELGEVVFLELPQRVSRVAAVGAAGAEVAIGSLVQPGTEVLGVASPGDLPTEGIDVLALEENLVALGFDPDGTLTVDTAFDRATELAVERMQEASGAEMDGVVEPGDVVFAPGSLRISARLVAVGDQLQPGMPLLEATASEQVVTLELEATRQTLVAVGDEVALELPDGSEVPGTVAEISAVVRLPQSAAGAEPGDPVIDVTVTMPAGSTGGLDQSPVDILVTTELADQVLAVPVAALVAVAGGGYALELVDGAGSRFVGVELGLFSDGLVEVFGSGVSEGDEVVVPR
jgi:peptidoglycan hydrolase-like protein with peptidoglycan-binding domain